MLLSLSSMLDSDPHWGGGETADPDPRGKSNLDKKQRRKHWFPVSEPAIFTVPVGLISTSCSKSYLQVNSSGLMTSLCER
jgi:hypothetical protein